MFDVIVAGGSYAGMAAALQLARARRQVLVVDAGLRRNRFANESHGFLTRDGEDPAAIAAAAKRQLLAYPTVTWVDGKVANITGRLDGFAITEEQGKAYKSRRLILATGVNDILPNIPGLLEQWGKSVFHCPYCHGYELNQGQLGVLATGPNSVHQALMIPEWGRTTFFTNGVCSPNADELERLRERGVTIDDRRVASVAGEGGKISLQFKGGGEAQLDGLFTVPLLQLPTGLVEQLGCDLEEGPLGSIIKTDAMKSTSVDGVYACGDVARAAGSLTFAVADGVQAGIAAHRSLMFGQV